MKKIILIILCGIFVNTKITVQTYIEVQDSLFQYLDKSRITSGALYDRVFHWVDLSQYQKRDTVDYDYITQA